MGDGMAFTPLFLAIAAIVALAVGFGAGSYLSGQGAGQGTGGPPQGNGLTIADRNFIVNVANLQMDQLLQSTAAQAAGLDWCTAGGGQWVTQTRQAALNVTAEQAMQLQRQGAQVQRLQDGNYVAAVLLYDRGSCVAIPTSGGG